MAVFDHLNGTYSAGLAPEITQYINRKLQKDAENELVHLRDMEKQVLPKNHGKSMSMRRFKAFKPVPVPLKEGVTPEGQELIVSEMNLTVKPYGRHVEFTDELNMYAIDNTTDEIANLLSRQAMETLDAIGAEAKSSGKNVVYAKADGATNTSRADITATDKISSAHIKRAVRILEKNKAKRFEDGYYHAVVDPETKYDLTADKLWIDIATYQDKDKVEKYELGKMLGVKFYETTLTRIFKGDEYLYDTVESIAINGGKWDVEKQKGYFTVAPATAAASGKDVDIEYWCRLMANRVVLVADNRALIDKVVYDRDANVIRANIRYMDTTDDWTYASGNTVAAEGSATDGTEVHSTPIYGKGFCGTVNLGSEGARIQSIINPPGSSGALDPLAQRGTAAWKVSGFGAAVMEDAYGVRVEHAVSI